MIEVGRHAGLLAEAFTQPGGGEGEQAEDHQGDRPFEPGIVSERNDPKSPGSQDPFDLKPTELPGQLGRCDVGIGRDLYGIIENRLVDAPLKSRPRPMQQLDALAERIELGICGPVRQPGPLHNPPSQLFIPRRQLAILRIK